MNYITRLQSERDTANRELAAIRSGLDALRAYLQSSKFRCGDRLDGYVNTGDVFAYLCNAEDAGLLARDGQPSASSDRPFTKPPETAGPKSPAFQGFQLNQSTVHKSSVL